MILINDVHKKHWKGWGEKLSSSALVVKEVVNHRHLEAFTLKKEMVMWDLKVWLIFLKDILCEKQPFAAAD